ncbi:MAG: patatin family protein [Fibrobacteraceae bacterium]|nr:patatin family protein [Fibrobacteraceae bacterium]
MKTGLILEGGGMRGMFTCGILDYMMEKGLEVDGAVGVSAGACFGCNYKSRQPGRALRYNLRFAGDKRYGSFFNLIKHGDIYDPDFCYHKIPEELDLFDYDALQKNPMEFYMTVTDTETGKPFYKKLETGSREELKWMQASASMPLVSKVVKIEGKGYLDGGIGDSIPLQFFESMGYNRNIVILTQPRNYVKKKNSLVWLMRFLLRKIPRLVDAVEHRHIMYNEETRYVFEQEKLGKVLVFCPETPLQISRIEKNKENLQRVYDLGRKLAQKRIEEIREFLKK